MTKKTCSECFWFDPSTSDCKADFEPVHVDKETEACECFDEKFEGGGQQ